MGILETLRRSADRAAYEADRLLRLNRLQTDLATLEERRDAELRRIGEVAVGLIERGEIDRPELKPLVARLRELELDVADKQKEIAAVRAERPPYASAGEGS